ncbi:MAG: hypothetical protein AAF525_10535 [Pseudomonadota bacterium]
MAENSGFVILLDLGRVVVDLTLDDWSRTVCPDDPDYAIRVFWQSPDKQAGDIGRQSPDVLLQRMVDDDRSSLSTLAEARRVWQTMFRSVQGSESSIRWLVQTFPVWIASDTDSLHFPYIIEQWPMLTDVERAFVSYEIGATKSEPGFFEAVIDASIVPAECLILIDDRAVNCERAVSLGMQAIEFQDWSQAQADLSTITGVDRETPV